MGRKEYSMHFTTPCNGIPKIMLSYRPNGRRQPRILKTGPKQIYKVQVVTDDDDDDDDGDG